MCGLGFAVEWHSAGVAWCWLMAPSRQQTRRFVAAHLDSDVGDDDGAAEAKATTSSALGKLVRIPRDKVKVKFSRSSGPGGQNVNKLNTKADVRIDTEGAGTGWLDADSLTRLVALNRNKINREGELVITSQRHRTQGQNLADALTKLEKLVAAACKPPKERKLRAGVSAHTKLRYTEEKRRRGERKRARSKWGGGDD